MHVKVMERYPIRHLMDERVGPTRAPHTHIIKSLNIIISLLFISHSAWDVSPQTQGQVLGKRSIVLARAINACCQCLLENPIKGVLQLYFCDQHIQIQYKARIWAVNAKPCLQDYLYCTDQQSSQLLELKVFIPKYILHKDTLTT